MIKEKEKIKTQLLKALVHYKEKRGIDFFDASTITSKIAQPALESNELAVLLLRMDRRNTILVTTKSLIVSQKYSTPYRINGNEIERYDFVNNLKAMSGEDALKFKKLYTLKSWLYSGDFRIVKKDETVIEVYLPNADFGFCMVDAIKKLQFVTKKYEAI